MQKFNAWRKRDWLIHFFFSTSSVCMIAIWPVGPPNEMNPSFTQNRNASPNVGADVGDVIAVAGTCKARRSIRNRGAGFLHRADLLFPSLSGSDRCQGLPVCEIFRPP